MSETISPHRTRRCTTGSRTSRRRFLAGAAGAVAAPYFVPGSVLGMNGRAPANDRIRTGHIGLGGRGSGLVSGFMGDPATQVMAVCDPYQSKRERAQQQANARYAQDIGRGTYKGCDAYSDFRDLVTRDDIDAVAIASPEFWHALHSVWAMRHGKDVYCEKAMTLTVYESQTVRETVRRHARVFQLGTQQRSDRNFRFAAELALNGYLGKLHTVRVAVPGGRSLAVAEPAPPPPELDYEMWLGPAPYTPYNNIKCSYNWYFIYDYCIGWIGSWGVHHVDSALWGAPMFARGPIQLEGTAVFPTQGLASTSITWQVNVLAEDGTRMIFSDDRTQPHGVRFEGDRGWVHVVRGGIQAEPASLLKVALKPNDVHLYESRSHHGNFLECIRTRRDPVSNVDAGFAATVMTIVSDITTRLERKLTWDWPTEQFVDDAVANSMLRRPMRSPWTL
ncbi:MAG: Gfo/Idh/MocA family oxidoreductase [Planctomycetes bacterium]|nr:Gfo/Idh/MocA family oxidoreductase [Planctomycetota bacterium]MBL7038257.1 Gfo/Idh/MocA family oxidoreductase [Pirellulaceae bacterium]